jgi:hypothetical protein
MMKRFVKVLLLITFCVVVLPAFAQEKQVEKAKPEEKPKVPVRVQLVFSEYDGDKKVVSMPYSFISIANETFRGPLGTSLRTGVRIPIETDGKDQKTTYLDVGSNIDCGLKTEEDGRFHLYLVFERSALYSAGPSGDEKLEVTRPNGQPLIRQFRTSEDFIIKDGQTIENVLTTDPLNGHVMRISITINVIK